MTKLNDPSPFTQNSDRDANVRKNSYEEKLSLLLDPKRLEIIKNLKKINPSVAELYSTTVYILENEYPLYQTFVAHGVREIVNNLTRDFEGSQEVSMLKKEVDNFFARALPNNPILANHFSDAIENIKEDDKKKDDRKEFKKVKLFLKHHLRNPNERNLDHYAQIIVDLKNDKFLPLVHNSANAESREIFKNNFHEFEGLIIEIWKSFFTKRKGDIESLLDQDPTEKNVNTLVHALQYKSIVPYFFSKLKNPKWLEPLNKKGLLAPKENWLAAPFIIKMTTINPDKVFEIIKPFLERKLKKGEEVNDFLLQDILQIAIKFPEDRTKHAVSIANAFKIWINKLDPISYMIGIREVGKFLENLREREEEKLALEILEAILRLEAKTSIVDLSPYGGSKEVKEVSISTKFAPNQGMGNYCYEEILKNSKSIFIPDQGFELFKSLYSILSNLLKNLSLKERKYNPSAIEDHEQDKYNTAPVYLIIAAIRDAAESVFEHNLDKAEEIFKILEKDENKIFTRIALHLLKKYPEKNKKRIENGLVNKDLFDASIIHHEYYLLLQQEFKNISEANQNKILKYIEKGPDLTNEKEKRDYTKPWQLNKFYCIKDDLTGKWEVEYKKLIKELKKPENPEFLSYTSPAFWSGENSPKKEDDIKKMSVQKIVEYLQEWKPTGSFGDPSRRGLGYVLEKDIENDPDKYLDNVLLFKNISEPSYIRIIFEAFGKVINKASKNWGHIIELGQWTLTQDKPDAKLRDHHEDDPDWSWCYKSLARFLTSAIKNDEKEKLLLPYADDIFDILKNITLQKDDSLRENDTNQDGDRYYNRAINSTHGEALASMIEYGLWLGKNDKKEKAKSEITPVLDELVNNSTYLETWAVFGRYLPWIDLIIPEWTKDNLDKIFPEDGGNKFDAAWLSYINFVNPFSDVLKFLKGKYLYVLTNHLYAKDKGESDNRQLGQHIAIYYARNEINIDDEIIKALFATAENRQERVSLFSFAGRSLRKEDTPKDMVKRFQELWDWRLKKIKGNEKEHEVELKEFAWWYKGGCFDEGWAIKQLYDVVVIHKVKLHWFALENKLQNDISEQHINKVWEIVKEIIFANDRYLDARYKELAIKCLRYIKDNNLEGFEDDTDKFINELGEKFGPQVIEEFEGFLG